MRRFAASFYQVNHAQTEKIYALAAELADLKGSETVWDLYCGIGTIGLSLAKRTGIGTCLSDISEEALSVAEQNAKELGVTAKTVKSDLFSAFADERFDIITVNPPYIPSAVIDGLAPEVQREPRLALDGGEDGLTVYRRLAAEYAEHLSEGGALVMEIGYDQGESVPALFGENAEVRLILDDNDKPRVVTVKPNGIKKEC